MELSPEMMKVIGQLIIELLQQFGHSKKDAQAVVAKHPEIIHEALEHGVTRLAARVSDDLHKENK